MAVKRAFGFLGNAHLVGPEVIMLSPGGAFGGDPNRLPPTVSDWGTLGWVQVPIGTVTGTINRNDIVTGGTSGKKARVIEISSGRLVVERINLADIPPGGPAPAGFFFTPTETLTATSGGTVAVGYGGEVADAHVFGVGSAVPHKMLVAELDNQVLQGYFPADAASNVWWDRGARLAFEIDYDNEQNGGFAQWDVVTSGSGGKALIVTVPNDQGTTGTLKIGVISGTFLDNDTLTVSGTQRGLQNGAIRTKTTGEWVPYTVKPNLNGVGLGWDFPPFGSDTFVRGGAIGVFPYVIKKALAKYGNNECRFLQYDGAAAFVTGGEGGIAYGTIRCTGTFPASGTFQVGETLTGPGGWTAKLAAIETDAGRKRLWVTATNGVALTGTPTITGATSGATATADGAVYGYAKGGRFYSDFMTEISTASAKLGGDTLSWNALFIAPWEGEVLLPPFATSGSSQSIGLLTADVKNAYVQWMADIRASLSAPTLKIVAFLHRLESQKVAKPNHAALLRAAYIELVGLDNGFRYYTGDEFELSHRATAGAYGYSIPVTGDGVWLETIAYPLMGLKAWNVLESAVLDAVATDLDDAAVVLITGQSQAVGVGHWSFWEVEEDPELGKLEQMGLNDLSTLDGNIKIYNAVTGTWQTYSCFSNAVNFGNGGIGFYWSMEVSLLKRLKERYGRIYAIKIPYSTSSMQATAKNQAGTWDDVTRPSIVASCTVTIPMAGVGRFTAASGTPFSTMPTDQQFEISGALTGYVGGSGNNTLPFPLNTPVSVKQKDAGGTWVEFYGNFTADATARSTTFLQGPVDLKNIGGQVIRDALTRLVTQENKIPRSLAAFTWQGEGDLEVAGTYQEACVRHIAWIRSVFGHRVAAESVLPIVWLMLTDKTPLDTTPTRSKVTAIRAAQTALASTVTNCKVVDTKDLPLKLEAGSWPRIDPGTGEIDYSRFGVHHTPRAAIIAGYLADAALDQFGGLIQAHPNGSAAIDFGLEVGGGEFVNPEDAGAEGLGTAYFEVETGTGSPTANSYATIEYADNYHTNFVDPTEWTTATLAQRQAAMRLATRAVDAIWVDLWPGYRKVQTQALAWPRYDVLDADGYYVDSASVPKAIQDVTCMLALASVKGEDLVPDATVDAVIKRETKKVGPLEKTVEYVGGDAPGKTYSLAEQRLRTLLSTGGFRMWRA